MPYTISDSDYANMVTQASYINAALQNVENTHPSLALTALHRQLNAGALILANAMGVASDTFGGNGSTSGTTPQSGGVDKQP